jgi:hypothetical protein
VSLDALRGPSQGTVQLMVDNKVSGRLASFAGTSLSQSDGVELGTVYFTAGENRLFLQLKADGESDKPFRTDLVHIICKRKQQ